MSIKLLRCAKPAAASFAAGDMACCLVSGLVPCAWTSSTRPGAPCSVRLHLACMHASLMFFMCIPLGDLAMCSLTSAPGVQIW